MLAEIDAVLDRCGGVATRSRLLTVVTRGQVDHEVRTRQLVAPFSRALCRPWDADVASIRRRAALTSVGPPAALTHLTSLSARGLPGGEEQVLHVTVPARRCPRPQDGLVLHRVDRFPDIVRLDGLIVSTVADAIVESWPLVVRSERRAAAITAVRQRLVTTDQLSLALSRRTRVTDRTALTTLIGLLADGCESELEIWGHDQVFDVSGLRHGVRQRVVLAGGRRYRLDLAYDAEQVAVELDGSTHGTATQREHDTRRDAALAALGWLTVRFTHRRLTGDPDDCRRQLLAILARRSR